MDIIHRPIQSSLILLVKTYQCFIKPWLLPCCRYQPSCSEFARISLTKMPLHRALWAICMRIIACNPFSRGGLHLPHNQSNQ